MNSILKRYIAKTIFIATVVVAAVIIAVMFIVTLLGELRDIGEGDYGLWQAFTYVLMRLPNDIYQFAPMLILIGCIVGLSILSSHRELIVMRASGFSIRKIIQSTITITFIMVLLITLIGEWVAPRLNHRAEIHKENTQHAGQAVVTASGIWFHTDNNFIHVRQAIGRTLLEGVTRYQFDAEHHLRVAYYAQTMVNKNGQWVMNNVEKTEFFDHRTHSQVMKEAPWDLKFNANLLDIGQVNPTEMSLPALLKFARYLDKNGLQSNEYRYSFWQRVFQPIASLVMVLLALPFVLGSMHAAPLGWRIVVGILAGFGFYILNALLGQMSVVYQLPTSFAALLPLVIFTIIGIYLSKRFIKQ